MSEVQSPVVYRECEITPTMDGPRGWVEYVHKDYDGAPEHSYGPPADNRCGVANSIEDAKLEIDQLEQENV